MKITIDDKINQLLNSVEPYVGYPVDFDFRLYFHEVYEDKKGFDVVIGNPPYIQLQKALPDDDNLKYADLYKNLNYQTFVRTGDIYCLFYENGIRLLRKSANLNYITSNKWMRAKYGKSLRNLLSRYNPLKLIDLGPAVFKAATVDTNILLVENKKTGNHKLEAKSLKNSADFKTDIAGEFIIINSLNEDIWNILTPIQQKIKRRIYEKGKPLKDWNIKINRGIVTGFNEAFIISKGKRDELIAQDSKLVEIIKPLIRGKDIKRYRAKWADMYLIAAHNGYIDQKRNVISRIDVVNNYTALNNWFLKCKEKSKLEKQINPSKRTLSTRDDKGKHWTNLRNCTYYQEFKKQKVIWKRIGSIMRFSYSDVEEYCLDSTCIANSTCIATGEKIKYLTAILNSSLFCYQFNLCFLCKSFLTKIN